MKKQTNAIESFVLSIPRILKKSVITFGQLFVKLYNYFKGIAHDVITGDIYVKLSLVVMGAGYFRRKLTWKGVLITLLQALFISYMIFIGGPVLSKFGTLGTVQYESIYNTETHVNETNDYDNSFQILLFSVITLLLILFFFIVYLKNIKTQRELQELEEQGKHLRTIKDEVASLKDERFHTTLLTLPILGIFAFTVIPLIFMILVAFTNYDQLHMPPINLFTWVGFKNFQTLLITGSSTTTYAYAFNKVLSWTLIWAFFATFLTYIGGILLALLINSKYTKWPKMWRTVFVITIAVPQFVSLLLVRHFFATQGIMNTLLSEANITDWLIRIGLVNSNLSYVPFLTDPIWSKVMLILINCWIGFPYVMLITTGVLMNIPKDLYESAEIDGANRWQMFRKITMPYMLFVTAPYLITSFIHNMNNFNVIYLLTSTRVTSDQLLANANASDTDLLITWLFKLTQDYYNYKMASVIGIVIFVLSAIITLLAFNYTIRADKENSFQ